MFSCIPKKCFEIYFQVLGCVPKNVLENTFSTSFSHFSSRQRKSQKSIDTPKETKIKTKSFIKSGKTERERERERERKRERGKGDDLEAVTASFKQRRQDRVMGGSILVPTSSIWTNRVLGLHS